MADNKNQVEAGELLKQAEELTNIRSSGSHAFRLAARVKLFDEKGQAREGTYTLLWKSPADWQDKLQLEDFSQVRTATVDKLFFIRNPSALPLDVFQLLRLLEFPNLLHQGLKVNLKLREKTRNGARERTIEVALPGQPSSDLIALDGSSPIPTRVERKNAHVEYQFENYVAFNGHQFPRTLTKLKSKKSFIQIEVQELTEASAGDFSFVPLPDARWLLWCPDPQPATSLDPGRAWPIPGALASRLQQHHVVIYGVIGTDGRWHNLSVEKSGGKEVDAFWMNQMLQERFSPARCGDVLVQQESVREFY